MHGLDVNRFGVRSRKSRLNEMNPPKKRTEPVTMVDIARHSGVALSTVSYALSGKRPISVETRERVNRAIDELGYRPHAPAQALKSRTSRAIALFLPTSRNALEIETHIFLSGIAEATSELDYSLLVSTAAHDPNSIVSAVETGRADGVILMEVRLADDRVERLRADAYPFSLIGRCSNNEGLSYVDFDFEDAVETAVYHLHELGHRHIALLNRAPSLVGSDYGPTARSLAGFEKALNRMSLDGEQLLCGPSGSSYIEVLRFLEQTPECTAAITLSVTHAPLLTALRDLHRRVPEDFTIVAIIASQVGDLITPPLTTIEMPAFEMGRLGAEMLIRRLADDDPPPSQIVLRGPLQVRSSRPPPAQ
jgi:DNA-binding LacI/PurR family transcriptional regulator